MLRWRRSRCSASARPSSDVRSESSRVSSRASAGSVDGPGQQRGQRRDALAQVGARRLAGLVAGDVDDVVAELEDDADLLTELGHHLLHRRGGAGRSWPRTGPRSRSASRSCRRRPAGSGRAGPGRARDRRSRRSGPGRAGRRSGPGAGRTPGPRSATMSEARANSRSPTRIATVLPQREFALDGAPAQLGLVHHVVVVQAGDVGQLDDDGGLIDVRRDRGGAEARAEDDEQRTEPLAAGQDDVLRGLGDHRACPPRPPAAAPPRPGRAGRARRLEDRVARLSASTSLLHRISRHARPCGSPGIGVAQRRSADELARMLGQVEQRTGEDTEGDSSHDPNADREQRGPAGADDLGRAVGLGSVKNISTMTRM